MLDGGGADPEPGFTDGAVTVYASPGWLSERRRHGRTTPSPSCSAQLDPDHGYLAVQAYLDRHRDAAAGRRPRDARGRAPAAGHLRLGAAFPALHRAVPQGRTADRRLPPGHRPARARPRGARPARSPSTSSSSPRRSATGRCWPSTAGPVLRLHLDGPGRPGRRTPGARVTSCRPGPTRCATRRTGGSPDRRAVRHGALRRHRRPVAQEGDAGDLRPGQPRPAAAGVQPGRLRPPRLGQPGLRRDRARLGEAVRPHRVP